MARAVVDNRAQKPARWAPYMMSLPGLLCLYLFFIVPLVTLLKIALSVRVPGGGTQVEFSWEWANFSRAFTDFGSQLWRAFTYAALATILCVLIAYPIAYFIAFKAGKHRTVLLGLVMVPFFTSFLLRTIAWQSLFADEGPVLGVVNRLHLIAVTDALLRIPDTLRVAFNLWKAQVQARMISLVVRSEAGDLAHVSDEVHLVDAIEVHTEAVGRVLSI